LSFASLAYHPQAGSGNLSPEKQACRQGFYPQALNLDWFVWTDSFQSHISDSKAEQDLWVFDEFVDRTDCSGKTLFCLKPW
jgi:hypothetical protein